MSAVHLETRDLAALVGPLDGQDLPGLIEKIRRLDESICAHAALVADAVGSWQTVLTSSSLRSTLIDASWLHDIGKLTIAQEILTKPGPLDDDQWTEMRKHPARGADFWPQRLPSSMLPN